MLVSGHGPVAKVLAGAETAARASKHDHPRVADCLEHLAKLGVHLRGEAVEPVGPVERDAGNRPVQREVDGLVSHADRLAKEGVDANELAAQVAHHMLAAEGTGPAWDLKIEEVREDYARVSMVVRADMLNGHGFAHGGMIFALADSAFAYVCQWRQPREHGGAGLHRLPRQGARGRDPRCRSHRSRARRRAGRHQCQHQRPVMAARSRIYRLFAHGGERSVDI